LLLLAFTAAACNFPIKVLWYTPKATLDPNLFHSSETQTFPAPPAISTTLPTAQLSFSYDPLTSVVYIAQSGDTLTVVAKHFGISPDQITSPQPLPPVGLIQPGQQLILPKPQEDAPYPQLLLPDSAVVNSPCGRQVDIAQIISQAGGFLNQYTQMVNDQTLSGAEVVRLVAENTSVNPKILLAFIEFRSHWLSTTPPVPDLTYPLALNTPHYEGLYLELSLAAKMLNTGYYAWREGRMTEFTFPDGGSIRIAPQLNAGTVAMEYLFAQLFSRASWQSALMGDRGLMKVYFDLFGDPVICAAGVEPLFPASLQPPVLELPFAAGEPWALTGGLHTDWNTGTPLGALDFAPITGEAPCAVSRAWVTASADGVVTRTGNGLVQIALVDEANTPTGWELLYMHVAQRDRVTVGQAVHTNDRIGHPSCEGGDATGTHVHLARMYRGEWIGAGEPFPLVLSGWTALPGLRPYQSSLVKEDVSVESRIDGSLPSRIMR